METAAPWEETWLPAAAVPESVVPGGEARGLEGRTSDGERPRPSGETETVGLHAGSVPSASGGRAGLPWALAAGAGALAILLAVVAFGRGDGGEHTAPSSRQAWDEREPSPAPGALVKPAVPAAPEVADGHAEGDDAAAGTARMPAAEEPPSVASASPAGAELAVEPAKLPAERGASARKQPAAAPKAQAAAQVPAAKGQLVLATRLDGATVSIDKGRLQLLAPRAPATYELPEGKHRIVFHHEERELRCSVAVELREGKRVALLFDLDGVGELVGKDRRPVPCD
jgi:hypothetical protein